MCSILFVFLLVMSVGFLCQEVKADELLKEKSIVKIEIFDGPAGELHGVYVDAKKMYVLDAHSKSGLNILGIVQAASGDKSKRFCLTVKKDMIKKVSPFVNGSCQ
ncbi:hypothetical protein [Desulfovibrio sp. TomC]|uniref:hypothetical protein n=1 Tax=Desulfovibrio sp. TomC TaxID=1562888 RepID=UPI0005B9D1ED|nr:hypothetical protein [Desulfovibrio sp. TomC]